MKNLIENLPIESLIVYMETGENINLNDMKIKQTRINSSKNKSKSLCTYNPLNKISFDLQNCKINYNFKFTYFIFYI